MTFFKAIEKIKVNHSDTNKHNDLTGFVFLTMSAVIHPSHRKILASVHLNDSCSRRNAPLGRVKKRL